MLYKSKLIMLSLFTLFSNTALSSDCETLFHALDKQNITSTDKDQSAKFIEMENELFDAIAKCKTYAGMFVLMGELQIEMGQIPLALVYGEKSVAVDEKYWRSHQLLGSARMLNNQSEAGLSSLKKAVDLNPNNINTQLNLTSALIQNKKFDEALKLVNTIIDKNDKDSAAIAYYFRSQVYKGKGLMAKANKDEKTARAMGFTMEQR